MPVERGRLVANLMHFAPHPARGRAAGRAGQGHRRGAGGRGGRHHRPPRFLLDLARGLRQPARSAAAFRPGVSHLLAQPRAAEKDDGLVLPELSVDMPDGRKVPRWLRRLAEALHPNRRSRRRDRGDRDRDRRGDDLFRPRAAARRWISRRCRSKSWPAPRRRSPGCACRCRTCRRAASRPTGAAPAPIMRATMRAALRSGGLIELKRKSRAPAPAAARRAVRHLRLDEPLQPGVSAFHAHDHQRPRPGLRLRLRHAADQHHPLSALPRCRSGVGAGRRGGRRLVGRDPHRPFDRRVQPAVVAPPVGPGRGRAADHRRARPRRRHRARARDGPAAPLVPSADLAEPAVAL